MQKDRKLIINADGFGFTPGVNKGIKEAVGKGVVSSISCVVNFPYIEEVNKIAKNYPHVSIGIHFNLSVGKPVSRKEEVPSLVTSKGEFYSDKFVKRLITGKIKFNEMMRELEAQANLLEHLVPKISHFDGHQNKHLYPMFLIAAIKVAKKHHIKRTRCYRRSLFVKDMRYRRSLLLRYYLRNPERVLSHLYGRTITDLVNIFTGIKTADRLITPAYVDDSKKYYEETWINIIKTLPVGISEIYCHPGYPDDVLKRYAKYVDERKLEVEIITSKILRDVINKNNIEVISFNEL